MSKLHADLHIFVLHQSEDKEPTTINRERTQILIEKFFSMSVVTDCLKNIYKLLTVSELILNDYISAEEVLETINRLLNRKTAEPNRILNEVLKRITSEISVSLMQEIYTAFTCSLLSICYKKLTTIVLHKKDKKDYLLLRSYRSITLKNMLIKIIKKILVTHLSCAAEEYSLLL